MLPPTPFSVIHTQATTTKQTQTQYVCIYINTLIHLIYATSQIRLSKHLPPSFLYRYTHKGLCPPSLLPSPSHGGSELRDMVLVSADAHCFQFLTHTHTQQVWVQTESPFSATATAGDAGYNSFIGSKQCIWNVRSLKINLLSITQLMLSHAGVEAL